MWLFQISIVLTYFIISSAVVPLPTSEKDYCFSVNLTYHVLGAVQLEFN